MIDLIIYKATNKLNGKIYIGQTINTLEFRKDQHFRDTRCTKNKIRSTLVDLISMTKDRYDLKDFRSLFGCFDDVHNMKEFLYKLQEIIPEENVC